MLETSPRLVVFSTLFPGSAQPTAGLFIRERMFRVANELPVVVVAPKPWFPLQGLIRLFRPGFRPSAPRHECQQGVDVYQPRFLSIPGLAKSLDGILMALSLYWPMKRLRARFGFNIIDSHFGYPEGYAAVQLGRWLKCPVTLTLRGTEVRHARDKALRPLLIKALTGADRVITVSDSLRRLALELGVAPGRAQVVANGVDADKFYPADRAAMRAKFNLPAGARVLITVGGLVERKGFHRVIELMPALLRQFPDLHYLIVGGASAEGDWGPRLREQVDTLGLAERVHFLGTIPPEALREPLSAADVFVLSTRNEGWANVLLEAMACGLPVVTTDVGGNAEVVAQPELGMVVPFDDAPALQQALAQALQQQWDHDAIVNYARDNGWGQRIDLLCGIFAELAKQGAMSGRELPQAGGAD
ncbi:glycosyltransferase [Seongchinamella sediminis]|uniref:glycosyltransferase n=1 Tax=Seongchinamella sediminis TaxID=2283635 RepID=UPI001968A162|nr:glycosyltransferase [Seongchinamella sediminis]